MKIDTIELAILGAELFTIHAKKYLERVELQPLMEYGCKESGALKRASMELTRKLASLRKGE